jgi:hypothetical protein
MIVPFIPEAHIEREADRLLLEFGQCFHPIEAPPMPIEDILEKHLKLVLAIEDFNPSESDLHVLGGIDLRKQIVWIDSRLDPEFDPSQQGRYHYTLAHEIGHWQLHKKLFLTDTGQESIISDSASPDIICRDGDTKLPIETQAEKFAAFLLMPKQLVFQTWREVYPDKSCLSTSDLMESAPALKMAADPNHVDTLFREVARPLATAFEVSLTAMRIRLETLGLLSRKNQLSLI